MNLPAELFEEVTLILGIISKIPPHRILTYKITSEEWVSMTNAAEFLRLNPYEYIEQLYLLRGWISSNYTITSEEIENRMMRYFHQYSLMGAQKISYLHFITIARVMAQKCHISLSRIVLGALNKEEWKYVKYSILNFKKNSEELSFLQSLVCLRETITIEDNEIQIFHDIIRESYNKHKESLKRESK